MFSPRTRNLTLYRNLYRNPSPPVSSSRLQSQLLWIQDERCFAEDRDGEGKFNERLRMSTIRSTIKIKIKIKNYESYGAGI